MKHICSNIWFALQNGLKLAGHSDIGTQYVLLLHVFPLLQGSIPFLALIKGFLRSNSMQG